MWLDGIEWAKPHADKMTEVKIENDGFDLYGEYYDFGSDRCAVILSGRTESLCYGYYFAVPYAKNGYNVLVLDPRGHGLSDGEFNTVGFEESKDAIAWVKHIRDTFGISSFVFHGICIGAAAGMLALSSPDAPDCIHGIVTEGMFPNFGESMKNHMIEKRKQVFPTFTFVDMWMKHYTGHSMKYGPINVISGVRTPPSYATQQRGSLFHPGICREALQPFGSRKQASRLVSARQTLNAQNNRHRALRQLDR